jgi:hypothetical protein
MKFGDVTLSVENNEVAIGETGRPPNSFRFNARKITFVFGQRTCEVHMHRESPALTRLRD